MSLFLDPDPIPNVFTFFFHHNVDTTDLGVVWDVAKAYLRGQFIYTNIKTTTKAWERFTSLEVRRMEQAYIANPSEDTKTNMACSSIPV